MNRSARGGKVVQRTGYCAIYKKKTWGLPFYIADQSLWNTFVNHFGMTFNHTPLDDAYVATTAQGSFKISCKLFISSSYLCEFHPSSRTGKQHYLVAEFGRLTAVTGDLPAASLAREHAFYVLRGTSIIVSDTLVVTHESAHQWIVRESICQRADDVTLS